MYTGMGENNGSLRPHPGGPEPSPDPIARLIAVLAFLGVLVRALAELLAHWGQ